MLALTVAGSVGTLPVRGGLTGLAAGSCGVAGYWQLAPRLADGLNGGIGGAGGTGPVGDAELPAELAGALVDAAVLFLWLLLVLITVITTAATTAIAATAATDDDQDPADSGLLGAALDLSFEFALGCRTSLFVGRHGRIPPMGASRAVASGRPPRSWCCAPPRAASARGVRDGKLGTVLITGFPAGVLQCNCYVLAERPGTDAVIVDPGQRVMGPLRRILDENRLTPAAVLLTHGHIDHMWSAQKVSDTYGCPTYIHPEDRFMLKDPIYGMGPRLAQLTAGALFREPKQVVELDRDGDKIDLGSVTVNVDHTPGHTRGSVVFRVAQATKADDDLVFTGDTLFERSVGRTDLFGGSGRDLLTSILGKLLVLDDDTVVLPGHGNATTIGAERRDNPFLEGLSR